MALPFDENSRLHAVTRRSFTAALGCLLASPYLRAQQIPARIVSTAPSITEALFALGLGDRVVGVSRYCDFPPQVAALPKVGSYLRPDAEAIARLAPSLVVLQKAPPDLTSRLTSLHIPFVEVPHGTLDDVFSGIRIIAKAAAVPDRATTLIAQIQARLQAIQTKAKSLPSPRVLAILDRKQGTLSDITAVGPDNYLNQLLTIAGGANVLAQPSLPHYPHISLETIVRENPDVILDLSSSASTEAERQASQPAVLALWRQNASLAAVRTNRVFFGTSNVLLVPGPRAPEAAQRLFDDLHAASGTKG